MSTLWQDIKKEFIHTPSVISRIIFINIVVFLVANLFNVIFKLSNSLHETNFIMHYFGVSADIPTLITRPWTLITYGFLHFGLFHILFNLLALYWFGNIFTEFIGNRKVLPVYILGVVAGALLFIIIYNLLPVFQSFVSDSYMVGASAGVLAIIVAAATLVPDYTIFMILIGPVRLKWVALALVLLDLISIDPRNNAGGHLAHLGGALMGYVYVKQLQNGNDLGKGLNTFFDWITTLFSSGKKIKIASTNFSSSGAAKTARPDAQNQEKLDKILDKISRSGYESLTKEEKDFLFSYSKKER